MLNQAEGLIARGRKARSMSIRPAPARIGKRTPKGKVIENDTDFVEYLLDAEGVAVVQGVGLRPVAAFPHLLRHLDRGADATPAPASSAPARRSSSAAASSVAPTFRQRRKRAPMPTLTGG